MYFSGSNTFPNFSDKDVNVDGFKSLIDVNFPPGYSPTSNDPARLDMTVPVMAPVGPKKLATLPTTLNRQRTPLKIVFLYSFSILASLPSISYSIFFFNSSMDLLS